MSAKMKMKILDLKGGKYMKKIHIVLICAIISLISGIIGFVFGMNVTGDSKNETSYVGTYRTNTWNGKEAVIVLQKDKTMVCPNGSGTWNIEDGKLYIEYDITIPQITEDGRQEDKKSHTKQEVMIVEGGLMLSGHFFEKVNK